MEQETFKVKIKKPVDHFPQFKVGEIYKAKIGDGVFKGDIMLYDKDTECFDCLAFEDEVVILK